MDFKLIIHRINLYYNRQGACISPHSYYASYFQYLYAKDNIDFTTSLLMRVVKSMMRFPALTYTRESFIDYFFCCVRDKNGIYRIYIIFLAYIENCPRWFVINFLNLPSASNRDYYLKNIYRLYPECFK